jgi:hypothetical protein
MKYLVLIAMLTSCSTLKKTLIYSAMSGGLAGVAGGIALSPNRQSSGANAAVFGLIGASVAAMTGYALYQDDPRNYKLRHMLIDKKTINPNEIEIGLGNLKIDANLEKKEAHRVPVTNLPEKLKGKVNKQYLIKYQSKERYVKKGSKTFYIPPFEVFEHTYDEKIEGDKDE